MTSDSKYHRDSDTPQDALEHRNLSPMIGREDARLRPVRGSEASDPYLDAAKVIRGVRDRRSEMMPSHLFGEASWDILLALYIAHREQYRMTIMSVCNEAGVPLTTALRWLQQLVDEGLAIRRSNPLDRRTVHVELSSDAIQSMDRLMENVLKYNT
jgi:DNA-binding MarR family transcriptional regulator